MRKGYEAAVDGRRAVEPDQRAQVVDAVDDSRAYTGGIVDDREPARAGPHEAVGEAALIHVVTNHLSLIVQAKRLGEGATGSIQRNQQAEVQQEAVVYAGAVDVEPADLLRVVDTGGLRSADGRRNKDGLKNPSPQFVIDVGSVRG